MAMPSSDPDDRRTCPRLMAPWTWLKRHAWVNEYDPVARRTLKFCRRCGQETRGIFDFGGRRLDT